MIVKSYLLAGYAGALADVHRQCGDDTLIADALRNSGLTLRQLRLADADPDDVEQLARAVELGGGDAGGRADLIG